MKITKLEERIEEILYSDNGIPETWAGSEESIPKDKRIDKLLSLIETERKKSYAEGIRMLEWRINCDTLITELYGWKGVVDMAVEESFEREGGTEQRKLLTQTKGGKE